MAVRVRLAEVALVRGGFVPSAAEARERKQREERERQSAEASPGDCFSREDMQRARSFGIQPNALARDGTVDWSSRTDVLPVRNRERYRIAEGDLLLPIRSHRIQAVVARGVPDGTLALGHWAVITPNAERVDVDFLASYLNNWRTRARLSGEMVGSSLQFITVGNVREFEIDLPALEVQRRIGRTSRLAAQVVQLELRLSDTRRRLADAVLDAVFQRELGS